MEKHIDLVLDWENILTEVKNHKVRLKTSLHTLERAGSGDIFPFQIRELGERHQFSIP